MPNVNREFNFGQPMQGLKNTDDVHRARGHGPLQVRRARLDERLRRRPALTRTSRSPPTAASSSSKNVPAGTYDVEAWHEKLGTQTQNVTLGEKESKEFSFTFKAASSD